LGLKGLVVVVVVSYITNTIHMQLKIGRLSF
jgi:hypothetical protein